MVAYVLKTLLSQMVDGGGHHSNPVGPLEELLELYSGQGFPTSIVHSTPQSKFVIPPRAKRLSPETKFKLVRRYLEGESALALSKDLKIHRTTALAILEAAGVKRSFRALTEAQIDMVVILYRLGRSCASIGQGFAVNPETIRNALLRRAERIRGPHDWHARDH
jgi:hypothetical protein